MSAATDPRLDLTSLEVHEVYLKAEKEMHAAAVTVADGLCGFFPTGDEDAAQVRYVDAVIVVRALGDLWEHVRAKEAS